MYKRILYILFSILFFSSCHREWKRLSPKKMQDILVDMSLAQAYFQNHYTPDSIRIRTYSGICRNHGISIQDWDSSIYLYSGKYIETYKIIYQNAMDSVVRLQKQIQQKQNIRDSIKNRLQNILEANIDSVNLIADRQTHNKENFLIRSFILKPIIPYSDKFSVRLSTALQNLPLQFDPIFMLRLRLSFADSTDTTIIKPIIYNGVDSIRVNIPSDKSMQSAEGGLFTNNRLWARIINTRELSFVRLPRMKNDKDE